MNVMGFKTYFILHIKILKIYKAKCNIIKSTI